MTAPATKPVRILVIALAAVASLAFSQSLGHAAQASGWDISKIPVPRTITHPALYDISCPSRSFCGTVGEWAQADLAEKPLLAVMHNGHWSLEPTQDPGKLEGVSCPADGWCLAVGQFDSNGVVVSGGQIRGEVFVFKNGRWTAVDNAEISQALDLTDVSCPSRGVCFVSGAVNSQSGGYWPVIYRVSGDAASAWTPIPVKPPDYSQGSLEQISCPTTGFCAGFGTSNTKNAPGFWLTVYSHNRATPVWPPVPAGWKSGFRRMFSISCPEAGDCFAGGTGTLNGVTIPPLFEVYSNGRWRGSNLQPSMPLISCLSSTRCVGADNGGAKLATLRGSWTGNHWAESSVVIPGAAPPLKALLIQRVSCEDDLCVAIGAYGDARKRGGLMMGVISR